MKYKRIWCYYQPLTSEFELCEQRKSITECIHCERIPSRIHLPIITSWLSFYPFVFKKMVYIYIYMNKGKEESTRVNLLLSPSAFRLFWAISGHPPMSHFHVWPGPHLSAFHVTLGGFPSTRKFSGQAGGGENCRWEILMFALPVHVRSPSN